MGQIVNNPFLLTFLDTLNLSKYNVGVGEEAHLSVTYLTFIKRF